MNHEHPTATQQIFLVRRSYNQWVNNQTLEDYSLRFTAKRSRRWSFTRVANTALGAISFLALEAIGGAVTLSYGFDNTLIATLVVGLIIFAAGVPVCYYAAKYGVDIDLLTRGAGFGYIGSTLTSLIYASFTFIFFALEAAIMAKAIELLFAIPLFVGYILSSLVIIPLAFFGITFISRFQLWTQPLWVILQLLPFAFILHHEGASLGGWTQFQGNQQVVDGPSMLLIGGAASVMFALVAQIGEQVDFLRFLPEKNSSNKRRWWLALITAGPGWIVIGAIKILAGSFLAYLALSHGVVSSDAIDPTHMYLTAFNHMVQNPDIALLIAGLFVIVSQLKINVTNAYAGSIAWSNFFSRLTHSHPGRVVWLIFNVAIALLLMELGVYHAFENTLSVYAIVAVAWMASVCADLVVNKPLGLSPRHIEFKRAHLYDINPVGVGSMVIATFIGITTYLGFFGEQLVELAHFITIAACFLCVPLIAVLTRSRYYIARKPDSRIEAVGVSECSVCQNEYENEDIASCPAYEGPICSLCCSLDVRCLDSCKEAPPFGEQIRRWAGSNLPGIVTRSVNIRFIHFICLFSLVACVTGLLLALIYSNISTGDEPFNGLIAATLWKVFFILMIVCGVISWLFVLAHESRIVAQEESQRQTRRLQAEIKAHDRTDRELQRAKEIAEAANNAKSRYLTGISHELRTPLNAVLGYAQLLEANENIPKDNRRQITVIRRSSEHLADLIESLLDISKIEAGRLEIQKDHIHLGHMIDQIVYMFRLQAQDKGLHFSYQCLTPVPEYVFGDEKRLRQILINLLSNALKFTERGKVELILRYRNQVAEFKIRDSGIGIPENETERIFRPFERVRRPGAPHVAGTGLGLTITRLLTDIMGGDLTVESNPEAGSTFTLSLMLAHVAQPAVDAARANRIYGYQGPRKSVMVVDDDPSHRGLISDLLSPLGFVVFEAYDSESCLEILDNCRPDLFLIDRLMPGISGRKLAARLRKRGYMQPILMISANAKDDLYTSEETPPYNDYISKPVKLNVLLEKIGAFLGMSWVLEPKTNPETDSGELHEDYGTLPDATVLNEIVEYAKIGNLSKLKAIAARLERDNQASPTFIDRLQHYIGEIKFDDIINLTRVSLDE